MVNKESNPYSKLWGNYTLLLGGHLIYNIASNSTVFLTLFFVRCSLLCFFISQIVCPFLLLLILRLSSLWYAETRVALIC